MTASGVDGNQGGVYKALKVEYRAMASWYDAFWADYLDQTFPLPLRLAQRGIGQNMNHSMLVVVVDVGCGTGEFLRRLLSNCRSRCSSNLAEEESKKSIVSCYGIEPSPEMLEQARIKSNEVKWCQAAAESIPLEDSCADMVCSTNAFHFFRDQPAALQEFYRILRPTTDNNNSGSSQSVSLIITDWCADYWLVRFYHFLEKLRWNSWHGFADKYPGPLTSSRIQELVQDAGFTNVTVQTYQVRIRIHFFVSFWWGMQTLTAHKHQVRIR